MSAQIESDKKEFIFGFVQWYTSIQNTYKYVHLYVEFFLFFSFFSAVQAVFVQPKHILTHICYVNENE